MTAMAKSAKKHPAAWKNLPYVCYMRVWKKKSREVAVNTNPILNQISAGMHVCMYNVCMLPSPLCSIFLLKHDKIEIYDPPKRGLNNFLHIFK